MVTGPQGPARFPGGRWVLMDAGALGRVALALAAGLALAGAPAAAAAPGDLDPAFSSDGRLAVVPASDGSFVARAATVVAGDRLLVGGASCAPGPSRDATCLTDGDSSFRLVRLSPDGGLDAEFGAGGFVTTPLGDGRSQAFDLLPLPDGSVVAGGVARLAGRDVFALVRYDARGARVRSFGVDGVVLQPVGLGFAAIADLAAGPGGTIYAAGQALDAADRGRTAVARFRADGTLDGSFGTAGQTLAGAAYGYALGLVVAADGTATTAGIAGSSSGPAGYRFGEVRTTPTGALDLGFGRDGVSEQVVGSSSGFATALVARPGGRWLAAGAATVPDGRQAMALVQGTAAGALDPAFGTDGVRLLPAGAGAVANDVVALPDGRVAAIGQVAGADGGYAFGTAKVDAAGAPDGAWGPGGVRTGGWDRCPVARATAGTLQPDGRLVTAGIGCAGGGTGPRCDGGNATPLVARQLPGPPPPPPAPPRGPPAAAPAPVAPAAIARRPRDRRRPTARVSRVPRRITRHALTGRGLPVGVHASERVRATLELTGVRRGRGARPLRLVRVRRPGLRRAFALHLRAGRAPVRRVRAGVLRLELRLADAAGNRARRTLRVRLR